MSKNFMVAFFFAFFNLFCGAAEAVPLVNFDGDSVQVVNTKDDETSSALIFGAKELQGKVKGEYLWRAVIFSPGYLPRDLGYVMDSLRPGWKAWEKAHPHATLVVCSRIPTWCRVSPPAEVVDLGGDYQKLLDTSIQEDFFGGVVKVINLIQADIASRDASVKEKLRRETAAREAEELAEKAAAKKVDDDRKAALEHLALEQEALKTLVKEGGSSCWKEASEAEDLFRELAPTEVKGIYIQAAKATSLGHKIQAKMRNSSESRKEYLVLVAGILLGLLGTFTLWAGFSKYLRRQVKSWLELLEDELVERASFLKKFQGKTAETMAPMLAQLEELYKHLNGAKSNFLLFQLNKRGFVSPVYLWIVWRQFRLIRWMLRELLAQWNSTLRQIDEILRLRVRFQVEFRTLQGYSQEAVYVGVLARYESEFGEEALQRLISIKSFNPISFRDELLRVHQRHTELDMKMLQFAQLIVAARARSDSGWKITGEIYRLRGDSTDPIDSILERLRKSLAEGEQKAG